MINAIRVEQNLESRYVEFQRELELLINKLGLEEGSNTPDFVLAEYLTEQLRTYDFITTKKEMWEAAE